MTPEPLHRRIYADLEGRILSGELSPGARIPFEHELTAQYGCSRATVSKALSELAGRGLVTRRRRAGSFVAQPKAHAAFLAIPDLRAEVMERGQRDRSGRGSPSDKGGFSIHSAWNLASGL